jgi:dolichol-phosphate mannosyltransferase
MVLGIRDFSQKHVPWKSRFGNVITRNVFYYFTGEVLTDTQTGLRGFPRHVLPWLLGVTGARYDYEMNMLALAKQNGMTIYQVPIQTIYVKGNPTSHFNPIKDSYYVYKIFFKFGASGLASYGIDIGLFWLLCQILKGDFPHLFIIMATIIARACSSLFNYWVNRHMVFGQGASLSIFKYYALAVTVMLVSAGAVQGLYALLGTGEVYLKVLVDIILFLASFLSQKYWVFRKRA